MTTQYSDILAQIYNEFDPNKPAKHDQYVNLSDVRGGDQFIHKVCQSLNRNQGGFVRALFTGHIGCGKSSELRHLADEMKHQKRKLSTKRYYPIVVDILDYVNPHDSSISEILLSTLLEVTYQLEKEEKIVAKHSSLMKMFGDLKNEIPGILKGEKISVSLGGLKAEMPLKSLDSSARQIAQKKLNGRVNLLLNEINEVLDEVRLKVRALEVEAGQERYSDIVIMLDNLEKIVRIEGVDEEDAAQRTLFINGANLLMGINAHTLYTVPLRLVRADGQELALTYGGSLFVLPNVKVEERQTHQPWQKGRDRLCEVVAQRLRPYETSQAIETDALELILTFCGGHIRQFMMMIREASLQVEVAPIDVEAAQKAIGSQVPIYTAGARKGEWDLLAELELSDGGEWQAEEESKGRLLQQQYVLEYVNGAENQTFLEKTAPWYAVHPIVRELAKFKQAKSRVSRLLKADG